MEIAARAVQEGLEHSKYRLLNDMSQSDRPSMTCRTPRSIAFPAGIQFRSFAARDHEDQEPEDGLETGQMVFALTRTDKMDLDVFLVICEKAIVSRTTPELGGITLDDNDAQQIVT